MTFGRCKKNLIFLNHLLALLVLNFRPTDAVFFRGQDFSVSNVKVTTITSYFDFSSTIILNSPVCSYYTTTTTTTEPCIALTIPDPDAKRRRRSYPLKVPYVVHVEDSLLSSKTFKVTAEVPKSIKPRFLNIRKEQTQSTFSNTVVSTITSLAIETSTTVSTMYFIKTTTTFSEIEDANANRGTGGTIPRCVNA